LSVARTTSFSPSGEKVADRPDEGATWRCPDEKGFRIDLLNPLHEFKFPWSP